MASKLLFRSLRTLTTATRLRPLPTPTSNASSKLRPLIHQRMYAEAAATRAAPSSSTPPLPEDSEKALPNAKKVVKQLGTINEAEVAKFDAMAEQWWDVDGPHQGLHMLNPVRVGFIRSALCRHFGKDINSDRPLEGLKIADVGCGGGLLSEALARLGADVTAIDAGEENIKIASIHAAKDPETASIEFLCTTAEDLVEEKRQFDVVVSLEVIEHVANPADFAKYLAALTAPGGATLLSTPNRTMRSFGFIIVMVEYIMKQLPKGTHEWTMFITPEELALILQPHGVTIQELAGFAINPFTKEMRLSEDLGTNYIVYGTKDQ